MVTPTPAQVDIRDAEELDLLVIAPAGCGKTEAMALRVAGLIARSQVRAPRRVLVTTFTNRARDNIYERLRSYIRPATMRDRVSVMNFHGLAARIFRAHANVIGLVPELAIPEGDWVRDQCRSRKLAFKRSSEVQGLLRRSKQLPLNDDAVIERLTEAGDAVALEIEKKRIAEGRLTYDDLPRLAELILQNDYVADLYRQHFSCIIVDEFQDLTLQQLRIVKRIGAGRTTYAGDLAQGIYGFAGAAPKEVFQEIMAECSRTIQFAESHRSSPAVLAMVNALAHRTHGTRLACADPSAWPNGGLAATGQLGSTEKESAAAVWIARSILERAPHHRIGVIARTAGRRRFADAAFNESGLPFFRWGDGVLDTDTARIVIDMLRRLDDREWRAADDVMEYLRSIADVESVQDPSTREALVDALGWCCDLLLEGVPISDIRKRVRVGDGATLLSSPGVHLLTGHVGKGQQFDWVVVVGAEDGCIPDFRETTPDGLAEEARILSVMVSRARHGVVILNAANVEALDGRVWSKTPSRFLGDFERLPNCLDLAGAVAWLKRAPWSELAHL